MNPLILTLLTFLFSLTGALSTDEDLDPSTRTALALIAAGFVCFIAAYAIHHA